MKPNVSRACGDGGALLEERAERAEPPDWTRRKRDQSYGLSELLLRVVIEHEQFIEQFQQSEQLPGTGYRFRCWRGGVGL